MSLLRTSTSSRVTSEGSLGNMQMYIGTHPSLHICINEIKKLFESTQKIARHRSTCLSEVERGECISELESAWFTR